MIIETAGDFYALILDEIERLENTLLVWGVVDGVISEADLSDLIYDILDEHYDQIENIDHELTDIDTVVDRLIERGLLFKLPIDLDGGKQYRSRMAETVRLLRYLRQLFPKHDQGDYGWSGANTLVADYRFKRVSRAFPERDILASGFLEDLRGTHDKAVPAMEALTVGRSQDEEFKLSAFQKAATEEILDSFDASDSRGVLISAGTGSGKTLAFYLPALSRISAHIQMENPDTRWVKVVAIYPRNELLKDQFREVFSEARRLDPLLTGAGKRKIQIGAFFSPVKDVPAYVRSDPKKGGWEQSGEGYVCPFINCIDCGDNLIWRERDIQNRREILHCANDECGRVIGEDEIILTRNRMSRSLPDILFTTTEMMNQNLGNPGRNMAFGLQTGRSGHRPPEMMLLDEVHTYQGFDGAQVAYLLRRWQHAIKSKVTFIGLSATLKDGANFFANLCGLSNERVKEIKPLSSQMEKEGAEYTIALRGDPVSRSALLSTTIQTAMLMSRSLDNRNSQKSKGMYGTKLFVFTDKLDVINRLTPNLRDAEGRDRDGEVTSSQPLAVFRENSTSHRERYIQGQDWQMCKDIGHYLGDKKHVSKVSSQDPGYEARSDIIAATATLEVGFNDTTVGAVVQHQSPRQMAQFVQRKGRAGRTRQMRPWTAIILSDYGRDRLTYMAYEKLFDPELPANTLPTDNRYIQRIQSVYCLIEYLAAKLSGQSSDRSVWRWLAEPYTPSDSEDDKESRLKKERSFSRALRQELKNILEDQSSLDALASHIADSLGISEEDLQPILWEHPRPLITTVIPTALRRLATNWTYKGDKKKDHSINNSPLPEFATAALFSDLNLPEVTLRFPQYQSLDPKQQPVAQAMREFAPGRISRRYASNDDHKHWVCPENLQKGSCVLELSKNYALEALGTWQYMENGHPNPCPVFRVLSIQLEQASDWYGDTSNARLDWHTQIFAKESGVPMAPIRGLPLENIVENIQIFTHREENPIEIRRFSSSSRANINTTGERFQAQIDFVNEGTPAALGISKAVDALRLKMKSSYNFAEDLDLSIEAIRGLRTERYLQAAKEDGYMPSVDNPFAREWLANVYLTALIYEAISTQSTLKDAGHEIKSGQASLSPTDVLETIFQANFEPDQDVEERVSLPGDKLRHELADLLNTPETIAELEGLAPFLWSDIDTGWEDWLREKAKVTLAAAVYYAIQLLCPHIDVENFVVDISPGPREMDDVFTDDDINYEIWISETSPGGNGLIEAFVHGFNQDPTHFYKLVHTLIGENEFEIVDRQMTQYLSQQDEPTDALEVNEAVDVYRNAIGIKQKDDAFGKLRTAFSKDGYSVFPSFLSTFSSRILRQGSNTGTDEFFHKGISRWHSEEERLGLEIDARVFSYYWAHDPEIENFKACVDLDTQIADSELYNIVYGMFWPRGRLIRESSLKLYNEFDDLLEPERLLFSQLSARSGEVVDSSSETWLKDACRFLRDDGSFILRSSTVDQKGFTDAINRLMVEPIEANYLKSYSRVVEIQKSAEFLSATLELPELFR